MKVMEIKVDTEKLAVLLKESLTEILQDSDTSELKSLDWFTWETDFFIVQKNKKAA